MKRAAESDLLGFCVQQQKHFAASDWLAAAGGQRDRLALVAFLLASTRWYGHRGSLLRLADELHPGSTSDVLPLVRALDFDCPRFVHMLQARLQYESGA